MQRRALLASAALVAGLAALFWRDGWYQFPRSAVAAAPPSSIGLGLKGVAADLSRRAAVLASNAEVARSLEGGGIAVHRQALFVAARDAMVDAPPGSWIALADPAGNVLAWWGEAPSRMPPAPKTGVLAVRWSATQLELSHWRVAGSEPFTGIVCVARLLPVQSPDFGRVLGLGRKATVWEPASPEPSLPVLLADAGGAPLVAARYAGPGLPAGTRARALTLAAILALCLPLLAFRPPWVGAGLALALLAAAAWIDPDGRFLASPYVWICALGPLTLPWGFSLVRDA